MYVTEINKDIYAMCGVPFSGALVDGVRSASTVQLCLTIGLKSECNCDVSQQICLNMSRAEV